MRNVKSKAPVAQIDVHSGVAQIPSTEGHKGHKDGLAWGVTMLSRTVEFISAPSAASCAKISVSLVAAMPLCDLCDLLCERFLGNTPLEVTPCDPHRFAVLALPICHFGNPLRSFFSRSTSIVNCPGYRMAKAS